MICPLCQREMIEGPTIDDHHLIPKTFKGTETILIHKICHNKIHSVFTERELAKYFHTIERLLESEEMQKFVVWVSKKAPDFYSSNVRTNKRKKS